MNLRGRIERLENRRAGEDDTITLGDIVAYSYRKETDPRDLDAEERISRSRLGRMLAKTFDRGCRSDALVGDPAGEAKQNVSQGSGGNA